MYLKSKVLVSLVFYITYRNFGQHVKGYITKVNQSGLCETINWVANGLASRNSPSYSSGPSSRKFDIFPGTKWCGDGDIAENYDDLGDYEEVDKCCREHDYCSDIIPGHGSKYGLTNPASHSRLHCRCDYKFRNCLKKTEDIVANIIGFIYFNLLETQCYRKAHPAACEKILYEPLPKCVEYSYDRSQRIRYQWFDVPVFH